MYDNEIVNIFSKRPMIKPFYFNKLKERTLKYYNSDFSNADKTVMVGDELLTDIMFGNINKMVTVWVT